MDSSYGKKIRAYFGNKDNFSLKDYVTNNTLKGLFTLMAEEEVRIRKKSSGKDYRTFKKSSLVNKYLSPSPFHVIYLLLLLTYKIKGYFLKKGQKAFSFCPFLSKTIPFSS